MIDILIQAGRKTLAAMFFVAILTLLVFAVPLFLAILSEQFNDVIALILAIFAVLWVMFAVSILLNEDFTTWEMEMMRKIEGRK